MTRLPSSADAVSLAELTLEDIERLLGPSPKIVGVDEPTPRAALRQKIQELQAVAEDEASAADQVRKKVTKGSRKSPRHDNETLGKMRRAGLVAGRRQVQADLSMEGGEDASPASFPWDIEPSPIEALLDAAEAERAGRHRPKSWRYLTDRLRLIYIARALAAGGDAYAFSLNLTEARIREALSDKDGFTDRVGRDIARSLKRALNRPVPFWFAVHVYNDKGKLRPHIHGGLGVGYDELPSVLAGLVKIAGKHRPDVMQCRKTGEWLRTGSAYLPTNSDTEMDAVYIGPMPTADGWADYATQHMDRDQRTGKVPGRLTSASKSLRMPAQQLYETHRERLKSPA